MILTLNAAAKSAHKSKSAILEQIKKGKLSAFQDPETKIWQIDTAELFRVNQAPLEAIENQFEDTTIEPLETIKNQEELLSTTLIERNIELVDRERAVLLEIIVDLRERLDKTHIENSKLTTMLLTHQPDNSKKELKNGNSWLWAVISVLLVLASYSIYQLYIKTQFIN
jgi:hypothetical protein